MRRTRRLSRTIRPSALVKNLRATLPRYDAPRRSMATFGSRRGFYGTLFVALIFAVAHVPPARADEGGVSFWLPGTYGSLAAVPQTPGWTFGSFYYYASVSGGSDVSLSRELETGRFSSTVNANLSAKLRGDIDLVWLNPAYVFETPILGGQASLGMGGFVGQSSASVSGTVTASLPPFGFIGPENINSSTSGVGDLYPQASLKWNKGVNNFMVYATGDIPVGTYSSTNLSSLGIGHGAVDGGFGYTYLNTTSGLEFSGVAGLTYNLMNTSTHYQNGIDFHLDWGASQFLSEHFFLGAVGYVYDQITGDSGSGDRVGAFKSRVVGVGPQVGYIFPVSDAVQGYINLKGYGEFAAKHRPAGWNVWLTVSFAPAPPTTIKTDAPSKVSQVLSITQTRSLAGSRIR